MAKFVKAADLGGAAFDSSGQVEGRSNEPQVWVMTGITPDKLLYLSLHTTQGGAEQRLAEMAAEWGLTMSQAGEVKPCELETP